MFKPFDIVLDVSNKSMNDMFEVSTNDLNTIRLDIKVREGLKNFDLTGKIVRLAIQKPDKNVVFQTGGVTNGSEGLCEIILSRQANVIDGRHEAELMIFEGESAVAVTTKFFYNVKKAILNDNAVKSTSDFPAINQAIEAGQALEGIDVPVFIEAANNAVGEATNASVQAGYAKTQGDYAKQKGDLAAQRVTELNGVDAVQFKDRQDSFDLKLAEKINLINTANWGLSLTTDNASKINTKIASLDSTKTYLLLFDEIYPISSVINITNKRLMWGGGGGLKSLAPFTGTTMVSIRNCPNIDIQNLTFDGLTIAKWGIDIQDSEAYYFKNIKVENIGNAGINGSAGILVSLNNHRGIMVNVKVKNVIGTTIATGINVDNFRDLTKGSQHLLFDNCHIENIQPQEDADGIKILQSDVDVFATIKNSRFIKCAKRGIKAQSRYVYTENNYILDSWLAGIDFQRGYGKSVNDTIEVTSVGIDNMISVSGDRNHIKGSTLINTATDQSIADGIYINNVAGSNSIESLIIENVKMQGLRYPFALGGVTNIDLLRIDKCEIKGFTSSYALPSFAPTLTINTLQLHENKVEGSGSFFGFVHASHTINEYFATNNKMPGNIFGQAYPRKLGVIRDNTGQTFIEEKGIRYTWETVIPTSVSGSFYEYAKKGDIAKNTNLTTLGTAGTQYVIKEWLCIVDGDPVAHTKGTWLEVKVITGT